MTNKIKKYANVKISCECINYEYNTSTSYVLK